MCLYTMHVAYIILGILVFKSTSFNKSMFVKNIKLMRQIIENKGYDVHLKLIPTSFIKIIESPKFKFNF